MIDGNSERLVRDDALEQAAGLQRLGVDDEPPAFRAAQDEQVLDQAVEPLGFRAHVLEQSGRARPRSSARPGRARIWVSPRIVVIGVRSSWLMTSMNDSRNSPARRSSTSSSIALFLDATALGDVLAGAEHRDRPAVVVDGSAGPRRGSSGSIRPARRRGSRGRTARPPSVAASIAVRNGVAILGMDHVQVRREGRRLRPGLQAVLAEDRVGPGQFAGGDVPLPEAGARRREHEFQPGIARLDLLGKRGDLVERIDQSVAGRTPRSRRGRPSRSRRRRR